MAEITESKSQGQKTKRRPIKKILRPDLTAMVDVAFLLLTFFVMTSHMQNEENSVVLDLPDPNAGKTDTKAEKLLTLIPAENDRLFYYFGTGEKGLHPTEYGAAGLRTLILGHP